MGREAQRLSTRQKIMEAGFRLFAEKTINAVNLTDVSNEAGVSFMTVYRHFDKKPDLVIAINNYVWEQYRQSAPLEMKDTEGKTAAELFERYLGRFIDLYLNHRDILRFNQYFNAYIKNEKINFGNMEFFEDLIENVKEQFHKVYVLGRKDKTLRTEVPEKEMFSATLHLMLAAVTRYAVGLAYDGGVQPEKELQLLKKMLIREYTVSAE